MENALIQKLGLRLHDGMRPFVPKSYYYKYHLILVLNISFLLIHLTSSFAAFISKLLPPTGNSILDLIRDDHFYCYLVPLTILPTYSIIYLNWLSLRIFEHS
jgi:phosphatidylinositol N-acetylglucosaminyltransferase subunit Y